jgi:hypothetical protein
MAVKTGLYYQKAFDARRSVGLAKGRVVVLMELRWLELIPDARRLYTYIKIVFLMSQPANWS